MTLIVLPPLTDSVVPDLPDLAHDGWGLASLAIMALALISCVWIWSAWSARSQIKGLAKDVGEVREHTVNTHKSNLRDDLDDAKTAALDAVVEAKATRAHVDILVREMMEWRKDFGGIREELRDDREMHHKDVERIDRRIDGMKKRRP